MPTEFWAQSKEPIGPQKRAGGRISGAQKSGLLADVLGETAGMTIAEIQETLQESVRKCEIHAYRAEALRNVLIDRMKAERELTRASIAREFEARMARQAEQEAAVAELEKTLRRNLPPSLGPDIHRLVRFVNKTMQESGE